MLSRKVFLMFAAALATGCLVATPGCDWLKGSDAGQRLSPFLSGLSISPSAVSCDKEFQVAFHFTDPQGDISLARVTLQLVGGTAVREEVMLWPETSSRSSGTVSFPMTFACGTVGGDWSVTVQTEDDRNHTSNLLTGMIRLNAPGASASLGDARESALPRAAWSSRTPAPVPRCG